MFSRGNIAEKTRILRLETLKPERLGASVEETSAVDLYAGIGYFAFSFAKAGVGTVLCWEINPWSVEGFKRGAGRNKWTVTSVRGKVTGDWNLEGSKFIAFEESNAHASEVCLCMTDNLLRALRLTLYRLFSGFRTSDHWYRL